MRDTGIWCANFDHDEDVLAYGLDNNLWLMQYQYWHHDQTFQGGDQAGYTTRNWNQLKRVKVGHLLVAYLKRNRFFAIGRVRRPRKRTTDTDTIKRVVHDRMRNHHNFKGVVQYTDSKDLALYEDFTDSFKIRRRREWGEIEHWRYNQRIDVDKWEYRVDAGVQPERSGLREVNPNDIRCAVFPIKKQILDRIKRWLKESGGKGTL